MSSSKEESFLNSFILKKHDCFGIKIYKPCNTNTDSYTFCQQNCDERNATFALTLVLIKSPDFVSDLSLAGYGNKLGW
jgi:hypothetical protein